jgi:hypothetical protein
LTNSAIAELAERNRAIPRVPRRLLVQWEWQRPAAAGAHAGKSGLRSFPSLRVD